MNVAEKLTREIQRVTTLKGQYEAISGLPNVSTAFALRHINQSLEDAHAAQASGDVVRMIAACQELEAKQ